MRRAFLAATYGTARAAKKVHLDALRDAVRDPDTIRVVSSHEDLAAALAGGAFTDTGAAGIDRLTRMLVAHWLSASETNLENCVLQRWNTHPTAARDYLDRLTAAGYTLSEAEQSVYEDLVAEIAAEDEDEDEDDVDDDVDEQEADGPAEDASSDNPVSTDRDSEGEPATGPTAGDEPDGDERPDSEPVVDVDENEDSSTELNAADVNELAASA